MGWHPPYGLLRDAVGLELDAGEGIAQALFDQAYGKVGDVDADPSSPEFFRRMDGGAAAAERVEHHVAGVGGGGEDAFEEGDGLLGGVAETFRRACGAPKYKGPAEARPKDVDKI